MTHRLSAATAALLLLAGLAACATPEPRYPVRPDPLASAAPAPAPVAEPARVPTGDPEDDVPQAVPSGTVSASELPPLSAPAPAPPATAAPSPSYAPPPVSTPASPPLAVAPTERPNRYVVQPGDTLFAVGRKFGVSPYAIAELNGLPRDVRVRVGQSLRIPGGADASPRPVTAAAPTTRRPLSAAPPPRPVATAAAEPRPAAPVPAMPSAGTRPPPPLLPTASGAVLTDAQIAQLAQGRFLWPLRGEILSSFGPKGLNQRNDGVNIAAGEGTPVKAAAGGEVVYAGDQVPGYGNLVLVKHPDGFVTAYAHLSRTLVKNRDQISQGHVVGEAGASGGVPRPQLHFEVRYAPSARDKARPVNPELVLPR